MIRSRKTSGIPSKASGWNQTRNKIVSTSQKNDRGIGFGFAFCLFLVIILFFAVIDGIVQHNKSIDNLHSHGKDGINNKGNEDNNIGQQQLRLRQSQPVQSTTTVTSPDQVELNIGTLTKGSDGTQNISAAASIDQIVKSLFNLALMPIDDLRNIFDVDNVNDYDPFQLQTLEKGLCPWKDMSNSQTLVIEWLPKKALPQPSQWFQSRHDVQNSNNVKKPVSIYYEHLSKAGGTSFCKLAQKNMPRNEVPRYYCMPSSPESPDARVGSWTKSKLVAYFKEKEHRLVSNEWEPFNSNFLSLQLSSQEEVNTSSSKMSSDDDITLMFVTTIRNPINRLLSAYKFWGILHNEEKVHPTLETYLQRNGRRASRWKIMSPDFNGNVARFNFAVWKFSGGTLPVTKVQMDAEKYLSEDALRNGGTSRFDAIGHKGGDNSTGEEGYLWKDSFEQAIRTLARFDLVIPMELLSIYPKPITDVLGWENFETTHVVPSGKVVNNNASHELSTDQYEALWNANSLDMIIYYWTRAVYLTRLHCESIIL